MTKLIGYAVSADTGGPEAKRLEAWGCVFVGLDAPAGLDPDPFGRRGFSHCVSLLSQGDFLAVAALADLGASIHTILATLASLHRMGVALFTLEEGVDTSIPEVAHLGVSLALTSRRLSQSAVKTGLRAAAARGRGPGRPPALTREQIVHAKERIDAGETIKAMASVLGVDRDTLSRHLRLLSQTAASEKADTR